MSEQIAGIGGDIERRETEGDRRRAAQDKKIIEALAAGLSFPSAGKEGGVTGRTVARRMADPLFAAQVSQRRGELVAEVTGQLTTLSSDAVQVLRERLAADKPSDRMRAAHLILTLASPFRSDTELGWPTLNRVSPPNPMGHRTDQSNIPGPISFPQPENIIDFATNPRFLGLRLFPAQGTLLKIMALAISLFTPYDREVIKEWMGGFKLSTNGDTAGWTGSEGLAGDLYARIEWCLAHGRRWFTEIELLVGRRGSKNYVATIFAAWVIWNQLTLEDPHERYGIDPPKRLSIMLFAGKKEQADANMLRDLSAMIRNSECFARLRPIETAGALALFTPRQTTNGIGGTKRGGALVEIRAAESTMLGGRGPACLLAQFDEFAFLKGAGSTVDSVHLYDSGPPALAQFNGDAPVIQTTSPWDRQGQSWITYNRGLAVHPDTLDPLNPDFLVVELPSWALYRDADRAGTIPMWPGAAGYPSDLMPIITFDGALERKEAANPESFAVEYRGHWRSSQYAYLPPSLVDRVFAEFNGAKLTMATTGPIGIVFAAHGDPSLSQANFGFAIAHLDYHDEIPHVVFDLITHWTPSRFPGGVVDYIAIESEILGYLKAFRIATLTFDHWNSAGVIQRLQADADKAGLPLKVSVQERFPTAAFNWNSYEVLKTAIGHDLIHAPEYPQARAELEALQVINGKVVAPTTGDVRTKDVTDAMANVAWTLLGDRFADLADLLAISRCTDHSRAAWPAMPPVATRTSSMRSRTSGRPDQEQRAATFQAPPAVGASGSDGGGENSPSP